MQICCLDCNNVVIWFINVVVMCDNIAVLCNDIYPYVVTHESARYFTTPFLKLIPAYLSVSISVEHYDKVLKYKY